MLAFLCQFGGQFLITYGIANISASSGSIGLLMQPLTATILASFIFSEILNTNQILFVLITLLVFTRQNKPFKKLNCRSIKHIIFINIIVLLAA